MQIRKYGFFLILLIFLFLLGERVYLPYKLQEFESIEKTSEKLREENLIKKEEVLKDAYGFDDYLDYKIEYSKVLFRDIYHLNKEITVYKGSNQGIKKDNLVINKDGLVGVVSKTYKNSSLVKLLNHEDTRLSVKINDSYGILKYKENGLIVEGINNKAQIEVGNLVTTSDISIYPEDILIGSVKEIRYDKYEIEQILTVESPADFTNLSYIGILTDLRGAE